jgi:PTH1 family peptidyl-tRNA hydrolase
MKLIVGLGNPGAQYVATRHNVGFMVVDQLAEQFGGSWSNESKLRAQITKVDVNGESVILAKPATMMNLSGEAVSLVAKFYKIEPSGVVVVFDDVDVPLGTVKLRYEGGDSGHQGVRSVVRHIGSAFGRIRVGIDPNDRTREPSEVYVLKPFGPEQLPKLPASLDLAARIAIDSLSSAEPSSYSID